MFLRTLCKQTNVPAVSTTNLVLRPPPPPPVSPTASGGAARRSTRSTRAASPTQRRRHRRPRRRAARLPYLAALGSTPSGSPPGTPRRWLMAGTTSPTTARSTPCSVTSRGRGLIADALAFGIRTIIDVVPNHVSAAHRVPAGPGVWPGHPSASGSGSATASARSRPGAEPLESEFAARPGRGSAAPTASPSSGTSPLRPGQPDLTGAPDVRRDHEEILRLFDRGVPASGSTRRSRPTSRPSA